MPTLITELVNRRSSAPFPEATWRLALYLAFCTQWKPSVGSSGGLYRRWDGENARIQNPLQEFISVKEIMCSSLCSGNPECISFVTETRNGEDVCQLGGKSSNLVAVSGSQATVYFLDPPECKVTQQGGEYIGRQNATLSGFPCQPWASSTPNANQQLSEHLGGFADEEDVQMGHNFCRNPDGRAAPWCYNANGTNPSWEFCNIPFCEPQIPAKKATGETQVRGC
ncbi:unnamed protein product [Darwinula stevensoni]|uniref:Kringle domain-containing protein n=1 Tax=Darwinula stevensoni TaxID=69355 RepID=A0A7R9A4Q3_9CRUS|nr:unnamed protein product [Darwinula stevensoni]CAG0884747.1 unnamed protein product [Darwinula stevensoni]